MEGLRKGRLLGVASARLGMALALAAALGLALPARAGDEAAIEALRAEIAQMRTDYEARIRALEARVQAAEAEARAARDQAEAAASSGAPGGPESFGAPSAPGSAGAARAANAFNPAISVILQGRYARFSGREREDRLGGFLLGPETGLGPQGFSLGESELDLSANVDDRFYGFFDAALANEGGETRVEVEEAYFKTLALPWSLDLKAGRFLSAIGYHNARHSHTWDFIDSPLVYEALLGGQLLDDGVQLAWLAPTEFYLELGAEALAGQNFPAGGSGHLGVGTLALFAKLGGDVGVSHSWKAGLSWLSANPRERESAGTDWTASFRGDSDLAIADLVWKWAPRGNYRQRNLVLQGEALWRHERGRLRVLRGGTEHSGPYSGDQWGFYLQGVFQPIPRWRLGLRYGQVASTNDVGEAVRGTSLDLDSRTPRRVSAMVDFSNSEFSRLRLQYSLDLSGRDRRHGVFLQYIMSLGTHGAHSF